ncbi:MAG: A24 family peptidase [Candidatus Woesearchaeota archaeon]|nr:A24 family peptidase [Candidatus Woesearchaeota archaeon]
MIDILLAGIALLGLGAASWHDLKTREVPDWITYGLIFSGLGIRFIAALGPESWVYFFSAVIALGITYLLGSLMYYTKQWGGGDAKMIMALGVIFSTRPAFVAPSIMPFLAILCINIIIVGALYGLIWGILLSWKHRKKFTERARELLQEKRMLKMRIIAISCAIVIIAAAFLVQDPFLRIGILTAGLMVLLYPYLWVYIKAVEKSAMYKHVKPQQLTEGDWVEKDILVNKRVIYKVKNTGIEKEDIQKLIQAKVKEVLVKEGIPFIPPFFLGTILTILQWNILNFI